MSDYNDFEAYWRAEIERQIYAHAEKVRSTCSTRSAGIAIGAIIEEVGNIVGRMPVEESK